MDAAFGTSLLWIAVILLAARLGSLVERWKQPAVLGELLVGIILGNLALLGFGLFEPIRHDAAVAFLAELGVIILLFQVGLESELDQLRRAGGRATLVAILGIALPFAAGYYLGPFLLPGLSRHAYLFLGATLTATSVGITARVFSDMGKLQAPEARIVLGAAVIDDVLGLILLAVVSAIVTAGSVPLLALLWIVAKAALFFIGSILVGFAIAPRMGPWLARVHAGTGMKVTIALSLCLGAAYVAQLIGLAPIVGAFAAGLILDRVNFQSFKGPEVVEDLRELSEDPRVKRVMDKYAGKHVEDLIAPIGLFLVPVFFVLTGVQVDLSLLLDPRVLIAALGITCIAVLGKLAAGTVAGDVRRWLVGWGMVPRGEVGLIFASVGLSLGVVSQAVYAVIVLVVILTTLVTPPVLQKLLA